MPTAALHCLMLVAILDGPDASAAAPPEAGRVSFEYRLDIGRDELRGPAPARPPGRIKAEVRPLLQRLRSDGQGLKAATEATVESFFTVADAFEALCRARHKASNAQSPIMRSPPPPAPESRGRRV
jgi:hypothetical protein